VDAAVKREIAEALKSLGITELYQYQYDAIQSLRAGKHTVIVAGTGMGKTEAFLIPILEQAMEAKPPTAIVIYPTKALARDQMWRIRRLADRLGIRAMVYDGDTPQRERRIMYENPPHIIVTNPDMVSQALMWVPKFRELVKRVRFLVLDDFHVYSGVFGTHMYMLLRRIKRFTTPTFAATSATIGNPGEFGEALFGERTNVVIGPTGRRGKIIHMLIHPRTRPKWVEAATLAKNCVETGTKCIVFADSHRIVELVYRALKMWGVNHVAVHRAGLSAEERRSVEEGFRRGEYLVVLATPTLELGIDIGDIDAAILATMPPTYSRYLQRIGRVGRRGRTGLVVQILGNDPMSTYYRNWPQEFYARQPEPVAIERENEDVIARHLVAMAYDRWIRTDELTPLEKTIAEKLTAEKALEKVGPYLRPGPRAREIVSELSLRGSPHQVKIKTTDGKVIGHRELPLALMELHPEAIYVHGGKTYRSVKLDLTTREAIVEPFDAGDLITQALEDMEPEIVEVLEEGRVMGIPYIYGTLRIRIRVIGYALKRFTTDETIGEYSIEPIEYSFTTRGFIVNMPTLRFSPMEDVDWEERAKAYHATEHVLISAAEIVVGASKTDLGGISYPSGHIVIYDSAVGGSGTAKLVLRNFTRVAEVALRIVKGCDCVDGCPKCVYSPYCGNNNKMLSRRNAIRVLDAVLRGTKAEAEPLPSHTPGIA